MSEEAVEVASEPIEMGENVEMPEELGQVEESNEPAVEPQKHVVKIDGEELEVSLDELIQGFQTGKASTKKFQEASSKMKQVEDLFRVGRENPAEILQAMGVDPLEWIENFVNQRVEEESLSPEERELRDLRKFKEEQELSRKQAEEREKAARLEQEAQQQAEVLDAEISAALAEMGVRNPTPRIIARVAEEMLADLEAGKPLNARNAVSRTQKSIQNELIDFGKGLSPEDLLSKFGDEFKESVRQMFLNNVAARPQENTSSPQEEQASGKSKKKGRTFEEAFGDAAFRIL